jgi:excisionase family DNA binding protein
MPEQDEKADWDAWLSTLTFGASEALKTLRNFRPSRLPRKGSIPDGAYLSLRESARLLRVSQGKVLSWIKGGRIKALNVGCPERPVYRIDRAALAKSLEAAAEPEKVKGRQRKPAGYVERY